MEKGDWHGYQKNDFEAIVDLKSEKVIKTLAVDFLQDTRSWILMPTKVIFYTSMDNKNFKKVGEVNNEIKPEDENVQTQKLILNVTPQKARYVKIVAKNFGKLPEWHQGYPYNGDAYIFISEIEIQ